jgi:hypothetical protein
MPSLSQSSVNRLVPQLVKLLGIKSPYSPERILDFITPTLELIDWLAVGSAQRLAITGAVGAGAAGYIVAFTVPATSWWLLREFSINCVGAAGATLQYGGAYSPEAARILGLGPITTNIIAGVDMKHDCLQGVGRLVLLPPGCTLGANIFLNTGSAQTFDYRASVLQFEA